jgi:hypothetical protein
MNKLLLFLILAFSLTACKKPHSPENPTIYDYTVTNISQAGPVLDTVVIDEDRKAIYLLFSNSLSSLTFPVNVTATFSLTTGAASVPASGSAITFNGKDEQSHYVVTASDGTEVTYSVSLRDDQIPDNGFESWYSITGLNGASFSEPGLAVDNTAWATANMGTSTFGVYCTTPVTNAGNTVAKIATGQTSLVPITAGTIFNGLFDVNGAINHPTDPKMATDFGIPFCLRPSSISFDYSYQPGSRYVQATLNNPSNIFGGFTVNDIAGSDQFTAYAVLEKRTATTTVEIARAEIVSGDVQSSMKNVTIPFTYTSSSKPTHIYIVFSSSKDGDKWKGAVGSTLCIDNVILNYDPPE